MEFPAVLVLGATGRIGRVLQLCWQANNVRWQARRRVVRPVPGWIICDPLTDPGGLARAAQGCDTILNLAGAIPGRGGDLRDNAALAEAAIRAGAVAGARVVSLSSAAVYGAGPGPLREDHLLGPMTPYGRAKADMERRSAALAHDLGVALCTLRIGNVAGLDAILGGWQPGFELDICPDGRSPRRSYIGAGDLAHVLAALCAAPVLPPMLNVAAPGMVEMGALLTAAGLAWTPRPASATIITKVRLDVTALGRLVPLPPEMADVGRMIAQWRALAPQMQEEGGPT